MSKKTAAEIVAEHALSQLDDTKERCAALVEAINVTKAREPGRDIALETILEYAYGFYGFMTGDEPAPRTVH